MKKFIFIEKQQIVDALAAEQRGASVRLLDVHDVECAIERALSSAEGWATQVGGTVPPSYDGPADTTACAVAVDRSGAEPVAYVVILRGSSPRRPGGRAPTLDVSIRSSIGHGAPHWTADSARHGCLLLAWMRDVVRS